MEPIEEFSFKPINEGLGFHRKKAEGLINHRKTVKTTAEVPPPLPQTSKTSSESQVLKTPLPKRQTELKPASNPVTPSKDVIDELVKTFKKPNETFIEETPVVAPKVIINPVRPQIDEASEPLAWMFSPFFVDAMLVLAMILSGLLITLMVTGADLIKVLQDSAFDLELLASFPAIIGGMGFSYMVLSRIFLGASVGEMIFDVKLGTTQQRQSGTYSLQVLARSFLMLLTGVFVLPMLSMLTREDYLGSFSGLRIYRKKRRG
jgi:hypothetical protein